jgi:dienelactone hydrolase
MLGLLPVAVSDASAQAVARARVEEQVLFIPRRDGDRISMLETTVYKPTGTGPFPLVVLNHGKSVGPPEKQKRERAVVASRALLGRGFVVVIPMRRGFSRSTGPYPFHGCDLTRDGLEQATDVVATLDHMTGLPYVDRTRMLVMGQSHGGLTSIAFSMTQYPGVRATINFAGGLSAPGCRSWEDELVRAASTYGGRAHYPSLWLYTENDKLFQPWLFRRMYNAYWRAGGKVKLVHFPSFGNDGHHLISSWYGASIWLEEFDNFIAEIGFWSRPRRAAAQ